MQQVLDQKTSRQIQLPEGWEIPEVWLGDLVTWREDGFPEEHNLAWGIITGVDYYYEAWTFFIKVLPDCPLAKAYPIFSAHDNRECQEADKVTLMQR